MKFSKIARISSFVLLASVAAPTVAAAQEKTATTTQISRQEMLSGGESIVTFIAGSKRAIMASLSTAIQAGNIVTKTCLNDKSSQIATALDTANSRLANVRSAIEAGASDRAAMEYELLKVLQRHVTQMVTDAQSCLGQEVPTQEQQKTDPSNTPIVTLPNLPNNSFPNTNSGPTPPSSATFLDIEWALKLSAVEEACQDPSSAACSQSLEEAGTYLKTRKISATELQNSLTQLIQTVGNGITNSPSNNVTGPLGQVFRQVSDILDGSSLNPNQKDNVLNKFTTTTVQIAVKKGLGGRNTGPEAQKLGTLLEQVGGKMTNPQTKQILQTVANNLKTNGTFPANLENVFPGYASPA